MKNTSSAHESHKTDRWNRRAFLKQVPQAVASLSALSFLDHLKIGSAHRILHARDYGSVSPTWPSYKKVQSRLEQWQHRHPTLVKLNTMGNTAQGRPILAVTLTDQSVPAETKEHVVMTAQHAGAEHSGATTVLSTMSWLLSTDPLAREILKRQIVVCVPVVNPDGYEGGMHLNSLKIDPHYAWTIDGPKEPDKTPEAVAIQKLVDQYQPEVLTDLHGHEMTFGSYFMVDSSSSDYRSEISRLLDESALAGGYPADSSQDVERMRGNPDKLRIMREKLGKEEGSSVDPGTYSYNRYHTIRIMTHTSWERGGLLRHQRLFQIGNEVWPGEYYPGYPTRVAMKNYIHMVTAYGQTAAQRRRSRVELWNKQAQIMHGWIKPPTVGMMLCVCATSPTTAERWLTDKTLRGLQANLKQHPRVNTESLQRVLKGYPDGPGEWGPQAEFYLEGGTAKVGESSPIEHGLSLRLRLPFAKARVTDLRMNGHSVPRSETDGFCTWVARGFSHVQINIPPARSKSEDFFFLSCEYDPGEERAHGKDWE